MSVGRILSYFQVFCKKDALRHPMDGPSATLEEIYCKFTYSLIKKNYYKFTYSLFKNINGDAPV